ncbi:MAG: hypothetical protein WCA56_13720, partial [Xanthobacteraceae bacterium]
MEEILASIRRIIADDDASKTTARAPEPPRVESQPPPQQFSPPPAPPPRIEAEPHPAMEPSADEDTAFTDQASDILDLTESMAAATPSPLANPPVSAMPQSAPQFRTIDGSSDVGFDEDGEAPAAPMAAPRSEDRASLISHETSAAVDSAFNALAQTVLVQ